MAKMTPVQIVKERFGSKKELAAIVISNLEKPEGVSQSDFERKISTVSNKKLLKLHAIYEELHRRFATKSTLIDEIMSLKSTGKPDLVYRASLEKKRVPELLDLHKALVKKSKKS